MVFFLRFLSFLPLPLLYFLAYLVHFPARKFYRPHIVLKNLRIAFPEKSEKEINQIKNKFYAHFTQIIVEVIKTISISEREFANRINFKNPELFLAHHKKGIPVFLYATHHCNWEWLGLSSSVHLGSPTHIVYHKLSNPKMEKLMKKLRSRFGNIPIQNKYTVRNLVKMRDQAFLLGLASDQAPNGTNNVWSKFFNKEADFYQGLVGLPENFEALALFPKITKIKRGYYEIEFISLGMTSENEKNEILGKYITETEKMIRENPENYLWSHNRWKRTRKENEELIIFPPQSN